MRITFLLPPDSLAGGMRVIATYAQRLANRGHTVIAVQPRHARRSLRETWRLIKRERHWPRDPNRAPSHFEDLLIAPNAGSFTRLILPRSGAILPSDLPDADIVIATWWETAEWCAQIPASKGKKIYFIQHHEVHMWKQPMHRVNATWRLPMKKIVIAPWLADIARNEFHDHNVAIVPNALDTNLFFAPPRGKQPTPTIGFMYSTIVSKGTDIAIKALELATQQLPDLRIISFGAEEPLPHMPPPPNTHLTLRPAQQTIREIYSACDAWLFSSRAEGFGLPILEAMACRTPVIGTPAGAAPDLLAPGGGKLVPIEDPRSMADAILALARMPESDWRKMSDIAHATATHYTWDDAAECFESVLQQSLQTPAAQLQSAGAA